MDKYNRTFRHPNPRLPLAGITGPRLYGRPGGINVVCYHVWIGGRLAFTAAREQQCYDWLVRTGWH